MRSNRLFIACIISLVATSFGFIVRAILLNEWGVLFNLTETQKGAIQGAGLFPFALSIILFSLIIDRVGYGRIMVVAWTLHVVSAILTISASRLHLSLPGDIPLSPWPTGRSKRSSTRPPPPCFPAKQDPLSEYPACGMAGRPGSWRNPGHLDEQHGGRPCMALQDWPFSDSDCDLRSHAAGPEMARSGTRCGPDFLPGNAPGIWLGKLPDCCLLCRQGPG